MTPPFVTPRLVLREWRAEDRAPFVAMNADPAVMRHFPATLTAAETDNLMERNARLFAGHGFGMWAVEERSSGEFAGFIGLAVPELAADFTPCVEIGWRLAARFWNRGLATEGAGAVLRYAYEAVGLDEVVSFTAVGNLPSRRVMEKLGLVFDREFDHPGLDRGHPLCRHVLYRGRRSFHA